MADALKKLKIGSVVLDNNLILAPMAGNRPAISFALQRTGSRTCMYGNGQCQSNLLSK